jgi:GH25 family lysozyme M1 (1,4-beta-N-acetylmuramidase)
MRLIHRYNPLSKAMIHRLFTRRRASLCALSLSALSRLLHAGVEDGTMGSHLRDFAPATDGTASVCPASTTVEGVDVSYYQGTINWTSVKNSGRSFAIARVSDGLNTPDTKFDSYWPAIKAAGMTRGVYQFFRPSQDPVAQADLLLAKVPVFAPGDMAPVLDVEVTDSQSSSVIIGKIQQWSDRIRQATGLTSIIYTSPSFWSSLGNPVINGAILWTANWGVTCPGVPSVWTNWKVWQYSATGAVPGITGGVDLDQFNGPSASLTEFTRGGNYFRALQRDATGLGQWSAGSDGGVNTAGDAVFYGATAAKVLSKPVVALAALPAGTGYWTVESGGILFSFGAAVSHGSPSGLTLPAPITGMAATPDGGGYWMTGGDGSIYAYGSATLHGSTAGQSLPHPIVGIAAAPDGGGYWLAGGGGEIYAFGSALNHGAPASVPQPVTALAATPDGGGYWLAGADGAVYGFGNALDYGSALGQTLAQPVNAIAAAPDGRGYWLLAGDGTIFRYGTAGCGWFSCAAGGCGMGALSAADQNSCSAGIQLAWSAPSAWGDLGGTRTFTVLRGGMPVAAGPCAGPLTAATLGCVDTSAPAGVASSYSIRATNGCGQDAFTPGAAATEIDNSPALPMSAALNAKSGVDLQTGWAPVAGAAGYRIYRAATSHPATWGAAVASPPAAATSWSDAGQLGNSASAYYTLTDVNSCGTESAK